MEAAMHHCTAAFESGNAAELEECFDLEIVLFAPQVSFAAARKSWSICSAASFNIPQS